MMPTVGDLSARSQGLRASADEGAAAPLLCQICRGPLIPGLDLGHQPVGDLILTAAQLNQPETLYPMQLFHCMECGLCQLGFTVDPAVVYKDFPFVSGTTATARNHLQGLARQLAERLQLGASSFVVDIGSNDGTLLEGYGSCGARVLGVDPSEFPVRIAEQRGIPTLHAFFNEETARHVRHVHGPADAISAAGCFAHIADLAGVMNGVAQLLKRGGLFVTDNQYWLDMVERGHYDNIFHQHLRNYSMKPLIHLCRQYGLEVIDVESSEVYGGSIRVTACHRGDFPVGDRVPALLEREHSAGLYEPGTFARFAESTARKRRVLFDAVYQRVSAGKKVIGIGAPAKASTVCNYCGLGRDLIDYVTEVNPLRIGKFLPGVHIPIVDEETMFRDPRPADAGILFSWNYYSEIVPKLRQRGFQGDVLCP